MSKEGLDGSAPAEGLNSSMVEEVHQIQQTEEPGVGRGSHTVHDFAGVHFDGFDAGFHRILVRMMRFGKFSLDAVFTEDVIRSCTSLHLGVVVMEYIGNAVLPDEILESRRAFAFSPHAIYRGKVAGLSHKKLCTGNAAQARGQTEQRVRGKGFGKSALVELRKASLDVSV